MQQNHAKQMYASYLPEGSMETLFIGFGLFTKIAGTGPRAASSMDRWFQE